MSKNTTRIQTTGVLVDVKERAEEEAVRQGFGSLNDVVRLFVNQFATGQIYVGTFQPQRSEYLSPERIAEYEMEEEETLRLIAEGKKKAYTKGQIKEMLLDLLDGEEDSDNKEVREFLKANT